MLVQKASITTVSLGLRENSIKETFSRNEKIKILNTEHVMVEAKTKTNYVLQQKREPFF